MPKKIKIFLLFIFILINIAVYVITSVLQIINCNYFINAYNEYYETLDLNSILSSPRHKKITFLKNIASFLKYFIIIIVIINFLFGVLCFYKTYKSSIKTEKNKSLNPIYIGSILFILGFCNVLTWVMSVYISIFNVDTYNKPKHYNKQIMNKQIIIYGGVSPFILFLNIMLIIITSIMMLSEFNALNVLKKTDNLKKASKKII
jgi:hypothetical protein